MFWQVVILLFTWVFIFAVLWGAGVGAIHLSGRVAKDLNVRWHDAFQRCWIGFTALVAGCQVWNFFAPVDAVALICAGVVAGIGAGLHFKSRARHGPTDAPTVRRPIWRGGIALLVALGLVYVTATGVATVTWSGAWDTDLYHFNTLRWMNEYAVVPGLGNLHSRLAHTSGFFVFSALFDNLWWEGQAAWFARGSLMGLILIQWVMVIFSFPRAYSPWQRLFCLLTLPLLLSLAVDNQPSLFFDQIAFVFQLALVLELLDLPERVQAAKGDGTEARGRMHNWLLRIVGLAAAGYSVKPIGAVSLLAVAVIVGICLWGGRRRERRAAGSTFRLAIGIGVWGGLVLAGHVSRNFVQTGWLAYPAPFGRTAVDWAMPAQPATDNHWLELQSVEGQYHVIKGWARMPGQDYLRANAEGFAYWFPLWKEREWRGIKPRLIYVGCGLAVVAVVAGVLLKASWTEMSCRLGLMVLAAANLLFWFNSAPDFRFGRGFFWIWVGVTGAMALAPTKRDSRWSLGVAGVGCVVWLGQMNFENFKLRPDSWVQIGRAESLPTRVMNLHPEQEIPLNVNVPVDGDRVGDCALPATPYPMAHLHWRVPGDIQAGFKWVQPSP